MGLGRWSGPCREWSGPRVQGREMWGATHFVGKSGCFSFFFVFLCNLCTQHRSPRPTPQTVSCPAWGIGSRFVSAMSYCVERSKGDRGAEMTMSIKHSHVGEIVWHQQILAGKCFSPAAKALVQAPRSVEDPQT